VRDPVERFASELRRSDRWDDARYDAAVTAVEERLEHIIERALAREVDPATALDHVVAEPTARSRAQQAEIAARRGPSRPDDTDDTGEVSWRA
jgi:TPP-dependent pyruvate/acetoin dehydrogenase alpha subunit